MDIYDLSFNQDFSNILVSTSVGHRIFNSEPFGEFYSLTRGEQKPTAILRMLFSTSLTVIVPKSDSGTRILHVYNLKQNSRICELTFPLDIVDIMLNRKRLVVFLEVGQIYLYDLSSIRVVKILDVNNFLSPEGKKLPVVASLSANDISLLVMPVLIISAQTDLFNMNGSGNGSGSGGVGVGGGSSVPGTPNLRPTDSAVTQTLGQYVEFTRKNTDLKIHNADVLTLEDIQNDSPGWILVYDTINLKPKLIYKAHDASIVKVAISQDATCIATASQKGTIVRVCHIKQHDASLDASPDTFPDTFPDNCRLAISHVTNLRRGHNHTTINALHFNQDLSILGCGSESNTIHFFTVKDRSPGRPDDASDVDNEDSSGEDSPNSKSYLEDLNENLANLLPLAQYKSPPKAKESKSSYFSAFKAPRKILNNHYTKSFIKSLPYRDYLDNLIWEKPRRSFAYVKLPEYIPNHKHHKNVEIGFTSSEILMLASYNTGIFYQYRLPSIGSSEREECGLMSQNSLID